MRRGKPLDEAKHRKWQQIIAAAACSGISVREFCRQRRIKEPQFYWWQRRLRSCGSAAARQLKEARPSRILKKRDIGAASFALVSDPSAPARSRPGGRYAKGFLLRPGYGGQVGEASEPGALTAGIELVLANGRRLRISRGVDEESLRTVLAALEATPC